MNSNLFYISNHLRDIYLLFYFFYIFRLTSKNEILLLFFHFCDGSSNIKIVEHKPSNQRHSIKNIQNMRNSIHFSFFQHNKCKTFLHESPKKKKLSLHHKISEASIKNQIIFISIHHFKATKNIIFHWQREPEEQQKKMYKEP